jgi:hypothetical protein
MNNIDILFACLSDGTLRQQECFSIIMSQRTPDVNGMTKTGKPLLVAACENGVTMEKMCLMLLERGADINATDKVNQYLDVFGYLIFICKFFRKQAKQLYMLLVLLVQ